MSTTQPLMSGVEGAGTTVKKGSAWISAKTSERTIAQHAYASDPKFKKYTQQVEKCLNSFDNVHEWADCIAFLKQLLKTFQSYMQFKEIPRKIIVSKRLSQCLNPALPTGVHQRALEVYIHILAVLGLEGLKRDLALWSSGLFPFFEYAATSVKPTLLNIYDTHYLPLQGALRPVMKSFILALLPGLEEETGEFFEKVVSLLDRLSSTVSVAFFFQNIWLVMLTTPAARGTSLNYLSRRLPRLNADEDITTIVGRDIGLMIRAFAAALEDENLLVRRGVLDILLQAMRVDSLAMRKAQAEDRGIIMRAAIGVVLRRDLSLNRRLYTWLLGPDDKPDNPCGFYKQHVLDLLCSTLRNEMFSPSGEYSESRPFKIFISLLDKWEIGGALANALVYDSFRAIKQLLETPREGGEDLIMTASTLYEALEPEILWKPLLSAIFGELSDDGTNVEALDLGLFVLKTFAHDEEVQMNHFPTIFTGLVEFINMRVQNESSLKAPPKCILKCFLLLEEMLKHIPHLGFMQRPPARPQKQQEPISQRPFLFACDFYDIEPIVPVPDIAGSWTIPFASTFDNLSSLGFHWAGCLIVENEDPVSSREAFSRSLTLLDRLVCRLTMLVDVQWEPKQWLPVLLQTFDNESATFTTVDRVVTLVIALHRGQYLSPQLNINERPVMHKMVGKLLKYLRPDFAAYHARAVNLICSLETSTTQSHVESIVAQTMTSSESWNVAEAYEAFGVLWRLTDDTMLPGFRFKVPMMIVLETLKSDDPQLFRIGESWMRCSLKSYLRILDPILYDLLDPKILRSTHAFKVRGRELAGYLYERSFDQRFVQHLLGLLLSVVSFAGQGFSKAATSSPIKRSHHAGLIQRAESCIQDIDQSYMEVLVEILLRFVQSEPKPQWVGTVQSVNSSIQSIAIQLLQLIVARGDIDQVSVESIEAIVVGKLYFYVHTGRLDLQNKLLHLLHSLISLSTSNLEATGRIANKDTPSESAGIQDRIQDDSPRYSMNPLLIQTLMDGISVRSNHSVIQHWLDFTLMAIPQFQPALQLAVLPLNDCICRKLMSTLGEVLRAANSPQDYADDMSAMATDLDFIMLLNGLERLILLSLAYPFESDASEEDTGAIEKGTTETSGLLGYVSNVFNSDAGTSGPSEQLTVRSPGYRSLDEGICVLYSIWATLIWKPPQTWSPREESLSLIYSRTRVRCRRALEHLFRVQSTEVFESIIDWWSKDTTLLASSPDAAFELVDVLVSTAQNAVHMICESIAARMTTSTDKGRKPATNPNLTDTVLFKFLELYLQRLEGPLALQVWSRYLQLVKDLSSNTKDFKLQNFPALRCLSVLAEKVTQTTAMEDKRIRKELQDTYAKLLDSCVIFVGRSSDQGSWIRRTTKEAPITNGRESPAPKLDEKLESSVIISPETPRLDSVEVLSQINAFVATSALPNLRRFLLENDKVIAACNNIIYYIVNPAMRGKTRPMDVDRTVISILLEMTRIPAALRSWRTPVVDLLSDNRLFNCDPDDGSKWKPIMRALYDSDKSAFPELLGKVAGAPSANIFTNREYEMLLRSLNIRRLSYILFAGEKNTFLTQLPTIQEKLVDILRNVSSPVVQSEVFLCIRVLLCRLSPHNLTSFWPVFLTEMYRIFEQAMTTLPADDSEDLLLVLAACKCLDLLLVLQTGEFQIYQWIFVTDTVDAVYRPDDWFPEAMMDQLAEIASSLPIQGSQTEPLVPPHLSTDQRPMRRPLLNSLRQIESMRDLVPFFSNVSISSYESIYASGGNIDWDAVEKGIMEDMFDGR